MDTRICTICKKELPLEENFPLNGDGKGGRRHQCKNCMSEKNKEWRKKNKTRIIEYNKKRSSRKS